jgi:hypothetical protein
MRSSAAIMRANLPPLRRRVGAAENGLLVEVVRDADGSPPVESGRVRVAMGQFVGRILVGVDEELTLEAKPDGPLGLDEPCLHWGAGGPDR